MAAATQARRTRIYPTGRPPARIYTIKAGEVIYKGTLAMHVAGVVQTAKQGTAGSVLLGIAEDTYDASAQASDYLWPGGMTFLRDPFQMNSATGGDQLNDGSTGKLVAVKNDQELTKTIGTDDLSVRVLDRESELGWVCEIP